MITIDLSDVDRFVAGYRAARSEFGADMRAAVSTAAAAGKQRARELSPVRTGELRGSVAGRISHSSRDGADGEIEATADHASYVNYGTSRMAARDFMGPAATAAETTLEREMDHAVERFLSAL